MEPNNTIEEPTSVLPSVDSEEVYTQPQQASAAPVVQSDTSSDSPPVSVLPQEDDIDYTEQEVVSVNRTDDELAVDPTGDFEVELDPRLKEIYERDIASVEEEADYAVEGSQEIVDNYNLRVEAAEREDEITGGQTALMIPKPEGLVGNRTAVLKEQKLASFKEKLENIQYHLDDPNPIRSSMVSKMLDAGVEINHIGFVTGAADWTPVLGAALGILDIPQNLRQAKILYDKGDYSGVALELGLSVIELGAAAIGTRAVVKKGTERARKLLGVADQMDAIRNAEAATIDAAKAAARKVAGQSTVIKQRLIEEFESNTGKIVSTGKAGKKVLDTSLAKQGGLEIAETVMELQQDVASRYAAIDRNPIGNSELKSRKKEEIFKETGVSETQAFTGLTDEADELVNPLLNPEKFDSIVAIAADFEKKNPAAFKDKSKSIIDTLFELTVQDELVDSQELADMLSKYALTFDDYILTVVGSGSEAGRILNKLSQIRRAGSLEVVDAAKRRKLEQGQNAFMKSWRRVENMRRGGMVSMIKTAARNFQSATIRAPMEALENVMDSTLLAMSNEFRNKAGKGSVKAALYGAGRGAQTLVSPSNWKGSTAALRRIYTSPIQAKEITDYLLDRPEYAKQFTALFDNVNEYQVATGRGSGGVLDTVLSRGEDVVNMLNTPNRIQEYVIRRGVFMGELERLVNREYGIDLMTALKEGKLPDLMADASSVRPKGSPQFAELIEDSTRRALDVTYAKAPDVELFKDTANFLTRTGLTAVTTPFPRFMFNSIELMGQYSAGAFNPALKRIFGNTTGPLTKKDRQNISRNISGLVAFTAAYQYRTSGEAPADYKQINSEEGVVVDVTSQYPMRQFLWIAEAVRRLDLRARPSDGIMSKTVKGAMSALPPIALGSALGDGDGTFSDWFDPKEALETFVGTGGRTGGANVFVNEIATILSGQDDLVGKERATKAAGRLIGDYLTTWAIPITQIVELQRQQGDRPSYYADLSLPVQQYDDDGNEIPMEEYASPTISGEIARSFRQRGVSNLFTPYEEYEAPAREFLFSEEVDGVSGGKKRENLGLSLGLGITQFTKDEEYGEYLKNKGFSEFEVGSRSRIPAIRREETKLLRNYVPVLVDVAKSFEADERAKYKALPPDSPDRKNYTEEQYVNDVVVPFMTTALSSAKAAVRGKAMSEVGPLVIELENFRKLTPKMRRYGASQFFREEGRQPDLANVSEVAVMTGYAKKFRSAITKSIK